MDLLVERVDVWAAPIMDQPGGLAKVLASLSEAGADLDFVIARRCPDKSGEGVLFVTPIRGDREIEAAANLGFNVTSSVHSIRVEGDNAPGIGAAAVLGVNAPSKLGIPPSQRLCGSCGASPVLVRLDSPCRPMI